MLKTDIAPADLTRYYRRGIVPNKDGLAVYIEAIGYVDDTTIQVTGLTRTKTDDEWKATEIFNVKDLRFELPQFGYINIPEYNTTYFTRRRVLRDVHRLLQQDGVIIKSVHTNRTLANLKPSTAAALFNPTFFRPREALQLLLGARRTAAAFHQEWAFVYSYPLDAILLVKNGIPMGSYDSRRESIRLFKEQTECHQELHQILLGENIHVEHAS